MISGIGNITRLPAVDTDLQLQNLGAAPANADAFSSMVSELATNTVSQLRQAETLSLKALEGDADTRAVVDAVMDAEQSLQAAIAIRDKIVSAYLEISRMAI